MFLLFFTIFFMTLTIGEYEYTINANDRLMEIGNKLLSADAIILPYINIVGSVIKKAIRLNDAFFMLVEQGNYEGALPLIRVQAENAMYLCATSISDMDYMYDRLVNGGALNQIEDRKGKKLTTTYLKGKVMEHYAAFGKAWELGNKYNHVSEGMVKAMVSVEWNENTGMPTKIVRKGLDSETYSDDEKVQIVLSMSCVVEAVEGYAEFLVDRMYAELKMLEKGDTTSSPLTEEQMVRFKKDMEKKLKPLEGGALVKPLFEKNK